MTAGPWREHAHASRLMLWLVLVFLIYSEGCLRNDEDHRDYLIQVGAGRMSAAEFDQAVASACKESFPGEPFPAGPALHNFRMRVLKQLTEEMVIVERGRQLGLVVSGQEIEQAVNAIKADYPDNTFEETLLENAVTFEEWHRKNGHAPSDPESH